MIALWIVLGLLALYALALFAVALGSVRPPRIPIFLSPGSLGMPQENVRFEAADGVRLVGWWVPAEKPRGVAVLAHGYVMNRAELAPVAHQLHALGFSCLLFDFRAHGNAQAARSTMGWHERHDVAGAVAVARKRAPGLPMLLVGSSMGSVASAFALADDPALADALVLDSAYSRFDRAVLGWFRWMVGPFFARFLWPTIFFAGPLGRFDPFRIDVAEALRRSSVPVLVLHGLLDSLATPEEARRNVEALGPRAETVWFEGCVHSEARWVQPAEYRAALETFVERWLDGP